MANKISVSLLRRFASRTLRSSTFCCGYISASRRHIQLFVSSKASAALIARRSVLTITIAWRMPANQTLKTEAVVDICVAQDHDYDRLLDFMRVHYYPEEPLTVGTEPKQQDEADEQFNMSNIKHGTCLMAVRRNDGEESIIGAVIAGPKDCHEVEHLQKEIIAVGPETKWGQILKALAVIERDANVFERFGVERAIHAHALGVHKCARGLAIGARLMQELMALGQKLNFQLMTTDCSSVYSARLCERLGMECVNVLRYKDYCGADGKQVFRPPPPHDEIRTYAIRLSDKE